MEELSGECRQWKAYITSNWDWHGPKAFMGPYSVALCVAALALIFGAPACLATEWLKKEMPSDGWNRESFFHVPSGHRNDGPKPMILIFHGGRGNARQIANFSRLNQVADKQGLVAVYPQGIEKHWNDGRASQKFQEHESDVNNVDWIEALVTELKIYYLVDPQRVFAVGISNGGIFTQRLGFELGHLFAAVASLTAQIP